MGVSTKNPMNGNGSFFLNRRTGQRVALTCASRCLQSPATRAARTKSQHGTTAAHFGLVLGNQAEGAFRFPAGLCRIDRNQTVLNGAAGAVSFIPAGIQTRQMANPRDVQSFSVHQRLNETQTLQIIIGILPLISAAIRPDQIIPLPNTQRFGVFPDQTGHRANGVDTFFFIEHGNETRPLS